MGRVVCGISFVTKKGTKLARRLRSTIIVSSILTALWTVHSVLYLSWLSVYPLAYAGVAFAAMLSCCLGTKSRSAGLIRIFHVGMALLTACTMLAWLVVLIGFVLLNGSQYASGADWVLNPTKDQAVGQCTDHMPLNTTDGDLTPTNPDGAHSKNPVPLGCHFYYNLQHQQITVFLLVGFVSMLLSCIMCVGGAELHEVYAEPEKDPYFMSAPHTGGYAEGKLAALLENAHGNGIDDLEGGFQDHLSAASNDMDQVIPLDAHDGH